MHSKSVDSLSLTRAGFIEYFLVATKLVHALTAIAPALFLLYYPGLVPVELRSNMLGLLLFFGALTVIMFQALDVYSDDIFSNRLRFRIMFFAWASAFCLLLFMYQGLGLFPYLSSKLVIFWFTGSLLLFGVQRLLDSREAFIALRRADLIALVVEAQKSTVPVVEHALTILTTAFGKVDGIIINRRRFEVPSKVLQTIARYRSAF